MEGRRSRTLGSDVPRVPGTREQSPEESETDEVETVLQAISPRRMVEYLVARGHLPDPTVAAGTPSPVVTNRPASTLLPVLTTDSELKLLLRQFLAAQLSSVTHAVPPSVVPSAPPTLPVPTTVKPPVLRFPDPPHYEGDPSLLESWHSSTAMYLRANGIDLATPHCVEVACMFLRGRAQEWFVSRDLLVQSGQAVQFGSWGEFVRELTAAFRPVELTAQHTQDLLTIAQGKHDMRVYVANFNSARSRVAGALDERTLSHVLLRGCRHDLRQAIALQNPQSLDAYISAAVLVADLAGEPPFNPQKRADRVVRDHKPSTPSIPLVVCSNCKKPGHTVDRCFGLHPELRKVKKKS